MNERAEYIAALTANERAMNRWRAEYADRVLGLLDRYDPDAPMDAFKLAHLNRELDVLIVEFYVVRLTMHILAQTGAQYASSESKLVSDIVSHLERAPRAVIDAILAQ